jgi:squalene monooxygenase
MAAAAMMNTLVGRLCNVFCASSMKLWRRCLKTVLPVPSTCSKIIDCFTEDLTKKHIILFFQPVAATINTLAGALYKVFCASSDEAMEEMRRACFDYLSLGGVFSEGPVALLSG